jgi:ubiquinol-cytochrome c reductase cytochrome c subunit
VRERRLLVAGVVVGVSVGVAVALPAAVRPVPSAAQSQAGGARLYEAHCATCHGAAAEGTVDGPGLQAVGAASLDLMLSTGRMPLAAPDDQPVRQEPAFDPVQIEAIIDYVQSLAPGGPPIPDVSIEGADVAEGRRLYAEFCTACHGPGATGDSIGGGEIAPPLGPADPVQIGEAIRTGPGTMPRWSAETIGDEQVDAIAAYLEFLDTSDNPGGFGLARIGAYAEGFAAGLVGLGLLIVIIRRTGTRT